MDNFIELSFDANERLAWIAEQYIDESRAECMDPFDIVAQLEEEQGYPINN
jgi:hypothetical protein